MVFTHHERSTAVSEVRVQEVLGGRMKGTFDVFAESFSSFGVDPFS